MANTGAVMAMDRGASVSERAAAKIAGVGYLAIFVLAIFANFFVRTAMIEQGDAAATVANIADSEGMFRAGLVSFLVIFVVDVVIAWGIYIVFRRVNNDVSLLSAWLRIAYTVLLGVGVVFFFQVLQLLSGDRSLSGLSDGQLGAQVMLSLDAFNAAWLIGLACFGIHLMLVGALIRRTHAPRLLGLVLFAAGAAYVLDTVANALLSTYEDYEDLFLAIVAVPSVIGELWLGLWLLLRGGRDADGPVTKDVPGIRATDEVRVSNR
jgi:hypothetical protein